MANQPNEQKQRNLIDYCKLFAELKVSKSKKRGDAPYKPILLLSVIDLIAQGIIEENKILVSDELVNTFDKYWNILASKYDGGLHYPFLSLQNDTDDDGFGFWHLQFKADFKGLRPNTLNTLKQAVEYATLDERLFNLIQDQDSRKVLIDTLISVWLISAQREISEILDINQSFQEASLQDIEDLEARLRSSESKDSQKIYLRKSVIRNAFFRKSIVYIYNYQCSFCGLKVIHSLTQSIVDGAHIKPFSEFYDNSITNGLSLCKNHHWAFDSGLFTIDNDYKIVISSEFTENSPNAKPMREFQGQSIFLPKERKYYPKLDTLEWHQNNVFQARHQT